MASSYILSMNACGMGCDISLAYWPETFPTNLSDAPSLTDMIVARHQDQALHGFSERVPELVMKLLQKAGITLSDLSALAVATGPGSFTGIRSSLAFLRALAQACQLPLYATTSFDGWQEALHLSHPLPPEAACLITLDTRRQDAYIAFRTATGQAIFPDRTATADQLYQMLADQSDLPSQIYLIGDICPPYLTNLSELPSNIICPDLSFSCADGLIHWAKTQICQGQTPEISALPYYIRPAEAKKPRLPGLQQLGLALSPNSEI